MNETWKHIDGLPLGYEISDAGNIRENYGDHYEIMRLSKSGKYLTFCIRGKQLLVHRLVADAFLPKPNIQIGRWVILHLDGDTHNNAVTNLQWINAVDLYFTKAHNECIIRCIEDQLTFNSIQTASAFYGIPTYTLTACIDADTSICGLHFQRMPSIEVKDCDIIASGSQITHILANMSYVDLAELQTAMKQLNK